MDTGGKEERREGGREGRIRGLDFRKVKGHSQDVVYPLSLTA